MNLLTIAPLYDKEGKIRYFFGAQVDVSGLVKDCTDLDSLQRLVQIERLKHKQARDSEESIDIDSAKKDELQELSEMFNGSELETVRQHGGRMHSELVDPGDTASIRASNKPRLLIQDSSSEGEKVDKPIPPALSGRLPLYQNVGFCKCSLILLVT